MTVRVALAGCGAWGENLLRALAASPRADVVAVADPAWPRLARARALAPRAALVPSLDDALAALPDAVVLATPSPSHADLALRALEAGADVLVEKPLALSAAQADRCAARAAALGRIGMVGHLLRYHPAVARLLSMAQERVLGEVVAFGATRLSTSGRGAASALWTLAPHDLSVLGALDASPMRDVRAQECARGEHVTLDARLESGVAARIELSRSSPTKERRLRVAGTARVAFFDDVSAPDRILVADARVCGAGGAPAVVQEIRVAWEEPLAIEVDHFLRCVEDRAQPRTPLDEGAAIVRLIERAEATLGARRFAAVSAG